MAEVLSIPSISAKVMQKKREIDGRNGLHCYYYSSIKMKNVLAEMPRIPFKGLVFSALLYCPRDGPQFRLTAAPKQGVPDNGKEKYVEIMCSMTNDKYQACFKGAPNSRDTQYPKDSSRDIETPKQGEYFWSHLKFTGNNITAGYINDDLISETKPTNKDIIPYDLLRAIWVWDNSDFEECIYREFHWTCPTATVPLFQPNMIINPKGAANLYPGGLLTVRGNFTVTNRSIGTKMRLELTGEGLSTSFADVHAPDGVDIDKNTTWRTFDLIFEVRGGNLYYTCDGQPGEFIKAVGATEGAVRINLKDNFHVINVISMDGLGVAA
ncbi:uncharacterized protein LOC135382999 [Ornithodoros turicata]|uniref:uncharacterized protein LOC135382999 n=1 Tax=Ornithodoros turicata TaxID=34597 RepID=UPI0031389880